MQTVHVRMQVNFLVLCHTKIVVTITRTENLVVLARLAEKLRGVNYTTVPVPGSTGTVPTVEAKLIIKRSEGMQGEGRGCRARHSEKIRLQYVHVLCTHWTISLSRHFYKK
jgi:hypothetical protein